MAHVLIVEGDPTIACMMGEVCEADGGHAVTIAQSEDEALAVLRPALHALVVVLYLTGDATSDTLAQAVLRAAVAERDTWAPHRFAGVGWSVPPATEELAAAVGLRMATRPHPDDLLDAVDAAAAELAPVR